MEDHDDFRRTRRHGDRPETEPGLRLRLARLALAWERLWPALWPATGILGLFLAVALSGFVPALGGWTHSALLLAFAAAFAVALARGLAGLRLPDRDEAIRRLERDSGLPHRPLGSLDDVLAGGPADPATAELWRVHRERLLAQSRKLRVRAPHPHLSARDTVGLRAVVGILLFIAATASWGDWRARLSAAATPRFEAGTPAAAPVLDIWVTPPEYTGLAPMFLKPEAPAAAAGEEPAETGRAASGPAPALPVPAGSTVLARVSGGASVPTMEAGAGRTPFEQVEPGSYEITQPVAGGTAITVEQEGAVLGSWPITVIPDQAPTVGLTAPPEAAERGTLHLAYEAADDYGIVAVGAVIRLDAEADPGIDRTPVALTLPRPKPRAKEIAGSSYHDLTPHPWAGLPVTIRVEATDGAGQTGTTAEVSIVLPERIFTHPVARAIIEQRRRLTLRPRTDREDVARALGALSVRPDLFNEDIVVFLGLRTSVARLFLDRSAESAAAVQQLLWDLALRVEDGQLSLAERTLRDAQQALMDALDRDAPDEEIQRLMDELQTAMNEFLDAMEEQLRQALERGEPMQQLPPQMQGRMLDRQDLQEMMEQIRRMAETGARDAARQMLSQLQNLMENLRAGTMAQMQQGQNPAGEMMQELQELARRQQELLDQTFRDAQGQQGQMQDQGRMEGQMPGQMPNRQGRQGQMGQGQTGQMGQAPGGAEQQEALRRQLGELMRRFGEAMGDIPDPLGRAERAMRDAGEALGQGQPGMAVPPQTQALDELQQGLQSMAEQMAQQMMGQGRQGQGEPGGRQSTQQRDGMGRDPLGRRMPEFGSDDTSSVRIPEEAELQRARDILDELRRRSGEFARPRHELDYIDRLLRQF